MPKIKMKELVCNYVSCSLNCDQPTFMESRGIKNIIARESIYHKNVFFRGHACSEDSDTNQPRPFARFSIYTSSVEFHRAILNPAKLRTKPKAKHGKKTRDGSKREDTSVTHESKLNNTAKSCINHPR